MRLWKFILGVRTHPDWYYRQSAAVPYRRTTNGLEVLLITSRRRRRWIVPKGVVEPLLTPTESAAVEAFEEAGVRGTVSECRLGVYEHRKWGGILTVEVFPLAVEEVLDFWPERTLRSRRWMSVGEAARLVRPEALGEIILDLPSRLP